MRKGFVGAFVAAAVLLLTTLPLAAQSGVRTRATARPRVSSTPSARAPAQVRLPRARLRGGFRFNPGRSNFQRHVFVPGFGLRPVVQERFPVFGHGFDAHHFFVLQRRHGFRRGFRPGFFGGGFVGRNFFAGGFFGLPVVSSSSSVVVVPQAVPVQVPVPVIVQQAPILPLQNSVAVAPGLPDDWPRLRIARSSFPRERTPLVLTLLVLKDHTIFAVRDYWLEDGRIFYVTSTGRQDSLAVRKLDWEMTTQFNAERGIEFVLESRR